MPSFRAIRRSADEPAEKTMIDGIALVATARTFDQPAISGFEKIRQILCRILDRLHLGLIYDSCQY